MRYAFHALRAIRNVLRTGRTLILETAIWRGDEQSPILYCPVGDDSPYDPASCTFFNEKGLADTLFSMNFSIDAVDYVADRGPIVRYRQNLKRLIRESWSRLLAKRAVTTVAFEAPRTNATRFVRSRPSQRYRSTSLVDGRHLAAQREHIGRMCQRHNQHDFRLAIRQARATCCQLTGDNTARAVSIRCLRGVCCERT